MERSRCEGRELRVAVNLRLPDPESVRKRSRVGQVWRGYLIVATTAATLAESSAESGAAPADSAAVAWPSGLAM